MKHMHYSEAIIEELLQRYSHILGKDIAKYKNHIYRVFFNCLLIDDRKENREKYAIAAVFHDIGIWTNNTIDYLYPSITQARNYLIHDGKEHLADEVSLMIYWHHKVRRYNSTYMITVETFRKADWIDVSLGFISFGVDSKVLKRYRKQIPNLGFHLFLIKRIIKNLWKHPLNPLPMFKG